MAKHTSSDDLDGAEPVPPPISTPLPVQKKARARKAAPETADPSPLEPAPDYASLGIAEADVPRAESLRLEFAELGRRSTSQVFECGRVVAGLHELATDQKHFTRLAKGVFKLSRTGAQNYQRVHERLTPYRERLEQIGMIASGLYDLATADPEKVEEVLAAREAGQELAGAQIKAMVGKGSAASAVSPDDGGVAGLKARIAEKTSAGVAELMDNAAALLEALLIALEPHRQGKRIVMKQVQRPFIHPARLVREQLEWLTWTAVPAPDGFAEGAIFHQPLITGDRWHQLHRTLADLGGFEDWPAAGEVGSWLNDTVVPELAWMLGERAKKCFAVIDKMAAAAEAERTEAEKAKERAKLQQKKLREKARLGQAKAGKRGSRPVAAVADLPAAMTSTEEEAASSVLQVATDA
jgi:hypothetical protein